MSRTVVPRQCPFLQFTRLKVGRSYCGSCLDSTPPNHPPVTAILRNFENLRITMDTCGVPGGSCIRFAREYKDDIRIIKENAVEGGVHNNFYNEISALFQAYYHRAMTKIVEVANRRAERERREGREGGEGGEGQGAAPRAETG
ncbi:hypothetical protein F4802DRAFT_429421 [Xylaria palmicola]|nr:hypothetical protein F4802DRAFT_429421 [Xylaria palmicola]